MDLDLLRTEFRKRGIEIQAGDEFGWELNFTHWTATLRREGQEPVACSGWLPLGEAP